MWEKIREWFKAKFAAIKAAIEANWAEILAQTGHFIGGYAAILTGAILWYSPWWGLLGLELWVIPKEFWWDVKYEGASVRGSAWLDFAIYHIGALLGFAIVYAGRR